MTTIDDILKEQGFDSKEAATFLSIIDHAKTLQKGLALDQLKAYVNQQIEQLIDSYED